MKLYFRLLWLFVAQFKRNKCPPLGPCETPLRVWPNDLDVIGHVNNGVYLTLMDLGRTDMLLRSGIFKPLVKNGWYPIVASETIRFYKSLKLWQTFTIKTEVAGWDDKSIFLVQHFHRHDELIATAVVNARFMSKGTGDTPKGSVSTQELLNFLDEKRDPPVLPEWIAQWHQAMISIKK